MSDSDQGVAGTGQSPREVPIDWEALEDAFENNAPEVHSYLNLAMGDVLRVVDGIADPEMHQRIATDQAYLRVEPVSSREQYRWMERFIPMVEDKPLSQLLTQAIDGKGAFRRFKDVLMSHGAEREHWFAFRSERLRVFMEAWLAAHALQAVARAPRPAEPVRSPESAPAASLDAAGVRRGRTMEALRAQLHELVDSLSARDLDKVASFAEFVKARRAARNFLQSRSGESTDASVRGPEASTETALAPLVPAEAPKPLGVAVGSDEDATPSSRRRPAAR